MEVGTPVATRTTPPPKLDAMQQAEFIKKVKALAPKYRTELLKEAQCAFFGDSLTRHLRPSNQKNAPRKDSVKTSRSWQTIVK